MNHPCWHTSMHEASHMAVYFQLGGKWNRDIEIKIQPGYGLVSLGVLHDQEHGIFLDFCVYAAGIAADRLSGTAGYTGKGSDTYAVRDLAIDLQYSEADIELTINKLKAWLLKYNHLVTAVANELICARNTKGKISKTKGKAIAAIFKTGLWRARKLTKYRQLKIKTSEMHLKNSTKNRTPSSDVYKLGKVGQL